jgi:hypothetical protein
VINNVPTMKTLKINLTIEKANDQKIWGSLTYNDNLITDSAESIPELEIKLKKLLKEFEGIASEQVEFECHFDVYSL